MVLSNAKPSVFLSGSQLFNTKAASPSEKKVDIGLYITFRQGNSAAEYIPAEKLFWDREPAVPLMTSSISWGLLEHDYGDLQFIHTCCCVEFLCSCLSCSELCDLLLWASPTTNSQQWLSVKCIIDKASKYGLLLCTKIYLASKDLHYVKCKRPMASAPLYVSQIQLN